MIRNVIMFSFSTNLQSDMFFFICRNMISAKWVGFQDPHSGIERFDWCIGTDIEKCNIQSYTNSLLSNSITFTGTTLNENVDYFVTVRAINKAGLSTSRSSSLFLVDTTPPYLVRKPSFITSGMGISYVGNTQWETSLLRLD